MKQIYIFLLFLCGFHIHATAQDCPDSCKYYIPNTLTPDCDGIDCTILKIAPNCTFKEFEFWLYDRFGEELFHSKDPKFRHDMEGYAEANYIWMMKGKFCNDVRIDHRGNILFIQ